jgi:TatD DNase family protein
MKEAKIFTGMGYYIGINGCSLKTQDNIEVMKSIPSEFLLIETGLYLIIVKSYFNYNIILSIKIILKKCYFLDCPW